MPIELIILQLVVLIMSAAIHEYCHGWAAYIQGDSTAKDAGRLTANPLAHLDPIGSFVLPLILFVSNAGFLIGYAKPVPFNPYNLRDQKWGPAKVALAGPASNLAIALFFGLLLRLAAVIQPAFLTQRLIEAVSIIIFINILLAMFNLVPIPPLDGSRILAAFLPYRLQAGLAALENYGMILVLAFVMFGWFLIQPVIFGLFRIITGIG